MYDCVTPSSFATSSWSRPLSLRAFLHLSTRLLCSFEKMALIPSATQPVPSRIEAVDGRARRRTIQRAATMVTTSIMGVSISSAILVPKRGTTQSTRMDPSTKPAATYGHHQHEKGRSRHEPDHGDHRTRDHGHVQTVQPH